jgi:hypothetical protein
MQLASAVSFGAVLTRRFCPNLLGT